MLLTKRENKIMKLNFCKPDSGFQPRRQNLNWSIKSYPSSSQQEFQSDTWVSLLELPSTFSFNEALLLCQLSEDEWVAWIPDHGEAVLHVDQFCACQLDEPSVQHKIASRCDQNGPKVAKL